MSYLDDLDRIIGDAEGYVIEMEYSQAQGQGTAYGFLKSTVSSYIKCARFCVECAKQKQECNPEKRFECPGGCVRPTSFEKFTERNKKLWYMMRLTRRSDSRYKIGGDMDNAQRIKYLFYILRQKVIRAREAKAMGWPDLFGHSIKTAEELVSEIETLLP